MVLKVHRVCQEAIQVHREQSVHRVLLAIRELLEHRVQLAIRVPKEKRVQ
jgi:hypothetical protein